MAGDPRAPAAPARDPGPAGKAPGRRPLEKTGALSYPRVMGGAAAASVRVPRQDNTDHARIAAQLRLNAAAFIVTIYGDIVLPRGGVLWTGTLIALCARVGISETLVRTAVSRLVAADQLAGERIGRRSFYRLQAGAAATFRQAGDLLYGPDRPARGWQILHAPGLRPEDARRQRMGHMGGPVFIRPDRGQPPPPAALVFRSETVSGVEPLAGFWDLSALRDGYARFLALFGKVDPAALPGGDALAMRLLLVHAYRMVLLRDPRLPPDHLPPGWNGAEARTLFRRLYRALTPAADHHIGTHCEGATGLLPAVSAATALRLADPGPPD